MTRYVPGMRFFHQILLWLDVPTQLWIWEIATSLKNTFDTIHSPDPRTAMNNIVISNLTIQCKLFNISFEYFFLFLNNLKIVRLWFGLIIEIYLQISQSLDSLANHDYNFTDTYLFYWWDPISFTFVAILIPFRSNLLTHFVNKLWLDQHKLSNLAQGQIGKKANKIFLNFFFHWSIKLKYYCLKHI